jgi:hypothetical protein
MIPVNTPHPGLHIHVENGLFLLMHGLFLPLCSCTTHVIVDLFSPPSFYTGFVSVTYYVCFKTSMRPSQSSHQVAPPHPPSQVSIGNP